MTMHIRKWGNSAAIRIPAAALAAARIDIDDPVEVREEGGCIVIEPIRSAPLLDLATMLASITPDMVHDESDFGPATGREAW